MTFKPTDYLPYDFANRRHIGPSVEEINEMLKYLKVDTLDDLIEQTIPEKLRQKKTA
jgi:glycine dehydrogenase